MRCTNLNHGLCSSQHVHEMVHSFFFILHRGGTGVWFVQVTGFMPLLKWICEMRLGQSRPAQRTHKPKATNKQKAQPASTPYSHLRAVRAGFKWIATLSHLSQKAEAGMKQNFVLFMEQNKTRWKALSKACHEVQLNEQHMNFHSRPFCPNAIVKWSKSCNVFHETSVQEQRSCNHETFAHDNSERIECMHDCVIDKCNGCCCKDAKLGKRTVFRSSSKSVPFQSTNFNKSTLCRRSSQACSQTPNPKQDRSKGQGS